MLWFGLETKIKRIIRTFSQIREEITNIIERIDKLEGVQNKEVALPTKLKQD